VLRFGGEVMKNVAGYDVSRLMAGAYGTLGVLLDVSIKILPKPRAEMTLAQEATAAEAIQRANAWAGTPLPLSSACHDGTRLFVRLSGTEEALAAARAKMGGETIEHAASFWRDLREQSLPFFSGTVNLWRLSVLPASPPISLPGEWLLDWGGAQRWLKSTASPETIRAAAESSGGHATCFDPQHGASFHPLPANLLSLHRRLKDAFDPSHILNRGALYPEI
jgi:glycolate oxidase FAD binding subunit